MDWEVVRRRRSSVLRFIIQGAYLRNSPTCAVISHPECMFLRSHLVKLRMVLSDRLRLVFD